MKAAAVKKVETKPFAELIPKPFFPKATLVFVLLLAGLLTYTVLLRLPGF